MGSDLDLHGVYVPLITPFTQKDDVALDDVASLANQALDAGAAGIVAMGTTGEPATLESDEKAEVIKTIAGVCRDRQAQLLIGAGTNSTKATLELVRQAALTPELTAILSVVPYYTRPSEAGIVEHFKAVAEASSVPVVLYNIPYRTGRALGAASLLELAAVPNIAGLKQAVGGIDADTMTLMASKPADFHVLSGDDAFLYPLLTLGGAGAIAASAHVCTNGFVRMVDHGLKGDYDQARELSNAILPVCQTLFSEPSPGVIKGVLHRQGRISTPALRAPMTAASDAAVDAALKIVEAAEQAVEAH